MTSSRDDANAIGVGRPPAPKLPPIVHMDFDAIFEAFTSSMIQQTKDLKTAVSASCHASPSQHTDVPVCLPSSKASHDQTRVVMKASKSNETGIYDGTFPLASLGSITLHAGDDENDISCGANSESMETPEYSVGSQEDRDNTAGGDPPLPPVAQVPSKSSKGVAFVEEDSLDLWAEDKEIDTNDGDDGDEEEQVWFLRPGWVKVETDGEETVDSGRYRRKSSISELVTSRSARMGDIFAEKRCVQKLIRHPDKRISILHALLASVVLLCDIVLFPLIYAFNLDVTVGFLRNVMYMTTIFWTLDIPFSFFQGFHDQGIVEMRFARVAARYLKSWFIFDFFVVAIDWGTYAAESGGDSDSEINTMLSLGRTFRISRFLRTIRVIRFMRLFRELQAMASSIGWRVSEYLIILGRLSSLIVLILLTNHYIACGWVFLALDGTAGQRSWLVEMGLKSSDKPFQYICSLHWSLTQFTPATNNIFPVTPSERLFATVVVLFGLLLFTTFVSTLTNGVMEIAKIRQKRSMEEFEIREFLQSKRVPMDTCMMIWHYYKRHFRVQKRYKHEDDIAFFAVMPTSLRRALKWEVYTPQLSQHPLFAMAIDYDKPAVLSMCDCVSERFLLRNREIFANHEVATRMVILERGETLYDCSSFRYRAQPIYPPTCIAEAVLWMKWCHCGTLCANNHCEVLDVNAQQFERKMVHGDIGILDNIRAYALLYLNHLSYRKKNSEKQKTCISADGSLGDTEPVTDLMLSEPKLKDMASTAFEFEKAEIKTTLSRKTIKRVQQSMANVMSTRIKELHRSVFSSPEEPREPRDDRSSVTSECEQRASVIGY